MAPGARDELMMCRSGGASVESLQSWGAALYAMAPRSRLHDSQWRSGWKDRYTNLASRDDETGRSLSEMETGRSLSERMRHHNRTELGADALGDSFFGLFLARRRVRALVLASGGARGFQGESQFGDHDQLQVRWSFT